jgi:hypothetical protein
VQWISNSAPNEYWTTVAASADGAGLVAALAPGPVFSTRASVALDIARAGSGVLLSWPWASAGYFLQQKWDSNPASTNWLALSVSPTLNDWRNQVQLPTTNLHTLCRLRRL